jgi:hypothetical protein
MTLTEVLVATMILAIVAGGAIASWSLSSRAAANKRAVEIGNSIAVEEIERLKAVRYPYLTPSPLQGGQPVPTVRWFDRYGNWLGSSATSGDFQARETVVILIDRDDETNSEDLKEITVEVWDGSAARMFERARTLITFGGV